MDRGSNLQIKTGERGIPEWMRRALLAAPGISRLIRLKNDAKSFEDPFAFVDVALRELQVQLDLPAFEEEKIPATGPVIVTSNHPYGGLDGLISMATIGRRRRDLKILVNPELAQLDGIGSLMIPVDPFGGPQAKRANVAGMRKAMRWLEDGGVLLIFPAGEVSHLNLRTLSITDPPWNTTAARLIRMSGAPVVPMYFGGANSALFQLAGIVHPKLRTLLLPHELGNKLGARVAIRLGQPLAPAKLAALKPTHCSPHIVWNTEAREIVGAYRLGRTDVISRRFGKRGLYTSTLFDYNDLFLKLLGPALELGRSFVRIEYQKSFASLMLLWKGIGEYVSRHPRYCRLIGPVSISNDYRPLSRELLVGFLRKRSFELLAPTMVRPKRPFRGRFSLRSVGEQDESLADIETLSTVVADLEPDGKGAPVLLRQYLKLGGRMLGFNVDPDFGDALDCLVLIDLRKTNPRVLRKYMSDAGWERFSQAHPRLRPLPSAAG
jgi:putative hemolysin